MLTVVLVLAQATESEGSARLAALPLGVAAVVILVIVVRAALRARRSRRDQFTDGSGG